MESTEEVNQDSGEKVLEENKAIQKPATPPPQEQPKKSKKEDRNKKDDKIVEQFMKTLNSLPLEEKCSSVCKKYVQTVDDNKKLQFYIKQSDKRYAVLLKEKEQLQHECNKTVLVKSKLENLCRELQKQNKAIKEEALLKIREEEERRKETQAKFQDTLSEITTLLQQNTEKNTKLRDDNISMTEKFKSVVQQYQLREQQVDKMAKQMALESQLSEAKLQKASLEHQAENQVLWAELEKSNTTLKQYEAKILEYQGIESALKTQLAAYESKYEEFQNALVKSHQVFGRFKEQMETMSKKIQNLEKESLSWKKRWETSQSALLGVCGERQASEERAAAANKHLTHMQALCRTLQADRNMLLNILKENNIERPPLPAPPPAPTPPPPTPSSNAKVDAMAANCTQLRQSLAHLQDQLNVLTNKKEESAKPETKKKSKSKKKAQKNQEKNNIKDKEIENAKDNSQENTSNAEDVSQNDECLEKIDDTMENFLQAVNMANIKLGDLDIGEGNQNGESDLAEVLDEAVLENKSPDDKEVADSAAGSQENIQSNIQEDKTMDCSEENSDVKEVRAEDNVAVGAES